MLPLSELCMKSNAPAAPDRPTKPLDVLIVDDHPAVQAYLTSLLERDGRYRVAGRADKAEHALALAKQVKPALIILDITLLDSNDLSCLSRLHAELPRTRILVFTGRIERTLVADMLLAGASGIVAKTTKVSELIDAIDRVAGGAVVLCPEASDAIRRQILSGPPIPAAKKPDFTARELTVLQHIASGLSSRQIAQKMGVSPNTITAFRSRLLKKTGEHNAAHLILHAARLGLIRVPGLRKATITPVDQ